VGIGELHDPETHLIPLIIHALFTERPVMIFGVDYPTPDGTAIRDYIHVMDIARAHVKALEHLEKTGVSGSFNLGTGEGHSVKKVIQMIEKVTGKKVPVQEMPRREGDAEVLVADAQKAHDILGWTAEQSSLDFIVRSALKWEEMRHHQMNQSKNIMMAV
jgi:UDP-glucose 4-epimerase